MKLTIDKNSEIPQYIIRYIQRVYDVAIQQAAKRENCFHVAAMVVDKSGNQIAVGCNNMKKSHPKLISFYQYPFLHAESAAILNCGRKQIAGGTVIVLRVRIDNSVTMSKPCKSCERFLIHHQIENVIYGDENGIIKQIKLNKIKERK
jgi:deoxycytidylate deaminase